MSGAVVAEQAGNEAKRAGGLLHSHVGVIVAVSLDKLRDAVENETKLDASEYHDVNNVTIRLCQQVHVKRMVGDLHADGGEKEEEVQNAPDCS